MSEIQRYLKEIVLGEEKSKDALGTGEDKAPIDERYGRKDYEEGTGGGSNSIEETDVANREYYDEQVIHSSDGIFTLALEPIKKVEFEDSAGNTIEHLYDEKTF